MSPFVLALVFAATLCLAQGQAVWGRPDCSEAKCVAVDCKPTQKLYKGPNDCCANCVNTFVDGTNCYANYQCREGSSCRFEKPGPAPICPNGRPCKRRCHKD